MEALIERYLAERRLTRRPSTVKNTRTALLYFVSWIARAHPEIDTFAEVTRDHILEFANALNTMTAIQTNRPLADQSKTTILASLSLFFKHLFRWGWDGAAECPLIESGDPRDAQRDKLKEREKNTSSFLAVARKKR
jgi:hypothetical protein